MPSSSSFRVALLTSGFVAHTALAYTQVNVPTPFMNKNIDPIVFPGSYTSHLHSFYRSDAVTASTSSSDELRSGCTNAENPNDLSTYWTPAVLYQSGDGSWQPAPVMRFSAYYGLGDTPAEVPFPENLMMVAGNATATTPEEMPAEANSEWFCEDADLFDTFAAAPLLPQLRQH